ncbi:BlaI/MecI/CopY family transcriptional regulator [Streptomyces roseoviridis]|uniref:BlaI/MecI/CopY family transcriptional regulator n=1 Tax=Streptomyces roseoviridis TaxID=67361 RepID=A0ABV5QYK5_9ACTN
MRRLGELEAEIMDRLWAWQRPATVREIVDDINLGRRVAYTTVMTVADILHRKGWLRREKSGRAWLYEPVRSREEYTAGLMQDALGDSQDRPAALLRFVETISDEDMAALDAALRTARRAQGPDDGGPHLHGHPRDRGGEGR